MSRIVPLITTAATALLVGLASFDSLALACGGGGSGSYRKPPRPGHQQHSMNSTSSQKGSTAPQSAPQ